MDVCEGAQEANPAKLNLLKQTSLSVVNFLKQLEKFCIIDRDLKFNITTSNAAKRSSLKLVSN